MSKTQKTKFRPIPGFDNYEISNNGIVRNSKTGRILKDRTTALGYKDIGLSKKGKTTRLLIHRLVAMAWKPEYDYTDNNYVVDHIDGSKHNNNLSNLRVISRTDNALAFNDIRINNPKLAKQNRRRGAWFTISVVHGIDNTAMVIKHYDSYYDAKKYCGDTDKLYFQKYGVNSVPELMN